MKSFNEMLKILEESKLADIVKDPDFASRASRDLGLDPRMFPSRDKSWTPYMSPRTKSRVAKYAGLPSERKDDRSSGLTSDFEKLRYYLTNVGGELTQQLKNIRKKGMFPDLFPSSKDVFAGFSPEQIRSLQVAISSHSSISGAGRSSKNPFHAELKGPYMDKIRSKVSREKFRRAAAKVPFEIRLKMAALADNHTSDGWQGEISDEDLIPGSPNYEMTIRHLKRKNYLGSSEETARELYYKWLKDHGYWED